MQMCVHVAVDLSNIFISRCMKPSVLCGLIKQLAAGWSCYWLQSEMWSDLSEVPLATAFGVLHSQTVWSGQEFGWLLPLHRADLPHSWEQCCFFTQMVFVSCLQGVPWGVCRGSWCRCQGRGQFAEQWAGCAAHSQPFLPLLPLHCLILQDERWLSAASWG